jgi:5-methylcytosine-specific restriction endonuclease McrA
MDTPSVPLKQCSRKEKCVNPLGTLLPATLEYFLRDKRTKLGLTSECRACARADAARFRRENPEKKSEEGRLYYQANREKVCETHRKWSETHKEHKSNYARRKRQSDPEVFRIRQQQYRSKNRELINERERAYNKIHPEVERAATERRRARNMNASGSHTKSDIRILLKSQKSRCWWCGDKIDGSAYHIDHRIPLSRGGSNDASNLCISCPNCNLSKASKLPQEWNGRLL